MSRRGPVLDPYDERDYYARPRANYEELDIDITRQRYPGRAETVVGERRALRQPDFLREDYGRTSAGPLVVREREREWDDMSEVRSRRGARERAEKDEVVIREREVRPEPRAAPRDMHYREIDKEEIIPRRGDRERERPRPREREREFEETDIKIRRDESEQRPGARPEYDEEDITYRRGERERRAPIPKHIAIEKEEIVLRRREDTRSPAASDYRELEVDREEVVVPNRERSRANPARRQSLGPPIAREREEYVFRRREPSPPSRDFEKEEIIIRRRERTPPRAPSLEPLRDPSPEPLPPVYRPPIIQEVITHHRHIDHGIEKAREPSPPPPPPPPARDESLEIEIRRRGTRNGRDFDDTEFIYERDTATKREEPKALARRRSASAPRRKYEEIDIDIRRGERKSSGRKTKNEMWTEVTKDLVIKEAIVEMGYEYEETDSFFYVIQYLKYEDVLQLVELSEDIRRERRERILEIQWEREELERLPPLPPLPPPSPSKSKYDEERIYEREVIYDSRRPGRYR